VTTKLNLELARHLEAATGKRYCRYCSQARPAEGGYQPPGSRPWRCARCDALRKAGPQHKPTPHAPPKRRA
jgi:transposase-like protein